MSKIKIEFGFGTGFSGEGRVLPALEVKNGIATLLERAGELFGGCTLTRTDGSWFDTERNTIVSEPGVTLSVLTETGNQLTERIGDIVNCIKDMLDQKAVAVTQYAVNFEII